MPGAEAIADRLKRLRVVAGEGSLSETDDLLVCSKDLGYLSDAALDPLAEEVDEISRMLYTLRQKVEREPSHGSGTGDPRLSAAS